MKFWLIFMIYANDGTFVDKIESQHQSFGSCAIAAGREMALAQINTFTKVQAWCVTDDHYNGVKQDEGIPYDMIEEEDVIGDIIAELP